MSVEQEIFAKGNPAFYTGTLLFPKYIRNDFAKLYSFVHTARSYIDEQPQRVARLRSLVENWKALCDAPIRQLEVGEGEDINLRVVKNICRLKILYGFEADWVDAFLTAMLANIEPQPFATITQTLEYVYGSAEVIGLMAARILRLPKEAWPAAALQARAMQWIQFLRDIAGNVVLGRQYFPLEDLQHFDLANLSAETAKTRPDSLAAFMQFQLNRYYQWQSQAEAGMAYLPRRARVAIQTVADGCNWTAKQIAKRPDIIFTKTVQPPKPRLLAYAVTHAFD
jgi:phytoene synthase